MTQTFEHGYAIVIGVDNNKLAQLALPSVAKDVQAMHDVLVHPQRCGYAPDNVRLLHGDQSTRTNILDALYWLQEKVAADPEATAIIYYSGHGMVDPATDQYYLIPYDIESLRRVRSSAIQAEAFNTEIAAMNPQRLLVLMDCCHANGMDVKSIEVGNEAVNSQSFPLNLPTTKDVPLYDPDTKDVNLLAEGNGRSILNSSTGAEYSYIRRDGKMSVFTYHLIEALTGHAPHEEGDKTVDVATVMSYVTRHVKKTIQSMGKAQTPVMRTTGVFPIAQLLGGEGIAKNVTAIPDPLEPLPPVAGNGDQMTVGDHGVGVIGDGNTTLSGERDVAGGDIIQGSVTHGDNINATVTGSTGVAIGRGASAHVEINHGMSAQEMTPLFAPLLAQVSQQAPTAIADVEALKAEVTKGDDADDNKMASLIEGIAAAAPSAVETLVGLFSNGLVGKVAGGATQYVLGKLGK